MWAQELRLLIEYEQGFKSPGDPLEEHSGDGRAVIQPRRVALHGARPEAGQGMPALSHSWQGD